MLFAAIFCRRGQPLKVFTDFLLGIANKSCCSAYARERHQHILTGCRKHLSSVDHDINCSSCSVVRCTKLTTGNKQLLGSYRSILYQQHPELRATSLPRPLMVKGKGKLPVTDPLARSWSTLPVPSVAGSPFLLGTFITAIPSSWPTPAIQIFGELKNEGGFSLLRHKFQEVTLMRGCTMGQGLPSFTIS